ncbi:high-affinity methionine permease protein [Rutstroemia sp. NJR-2017a BVV2]|nr:high-affinity methionine permease protein [Rutstroemia sp. NJR-2017a BVV2]
MTMGGFSQSRNFLGGAISTISTPLRNSAEIGFHCSSPVTPRRPFLRNEEQDSSSSRGGNSRKTSIYTDSTYLPTPRNFVLQAPNHKRSRSDENEADKNDYYDYTQSDITLVSPPESARLLPPTPSFRLDPYDTPEVAKLGTFSAINIILGKTVGVGIYSIPSSILQSVGSVGASLTLWIVGSLISFCGLAVYLDLGTALPRSGGERIYLERIFRKPRMLATCAFMSYVVLLGFSTPNCIVLGEYIMYALEIDANRWNVRTIAVAVITLTCFIHARYPRLGLRIINILGVGKMFFVLIVILSGLAGLLMKVGSNTSLLLPRRLNTPSTEFIPLPHPHLSTAQRNFSHLFAHSSTQPYDYATALLKILYCFRGYSTANQVLSSVRDPIRTLRTAAPIALSLVSAAYILANIAYFLVVELDDFKTAGVVVAGHFFKNIFGEVLGENVLPIAVVVSAFGNIAATSFAQARVNQELGNDGLLPFSRFFARNSNPGAEAPPTPGLFLHWFVSVLVIVVPPPGEIYNFLVDIGGYPVSVISVAISGGLLYLQMTPAENYTSPFRARKIYTVVFLLSNCLLLVLPWMKPADGRGEGRFAYYAYPATAVGVLGSGVVYWVGWRVWGNGRGGESARGAERELGLRSGTAARK